MATSKAQTVDQYLASLPADRRADVEAVRGIVLANLPPGYQEGMQFGTIGWYVPLSRYPDTYNGQPMCVANLAAQKNHLALYLMTVYGHAPTRDWFLSEYGKSGKKLDLGKSCLRFKSASDIPLELIGKLIRRVGVDEYVAHVKSLHAARKPAAKKPKPAAKKPAARKPAARRRAAASR